MRLNFPTSFSVAYPRKNLKYYNVTNQNVISEKLLLASQGFCMYCGKRINHDDNYIFNLEHSIEKTIDEKDYYILKHCKFNISVACPTCNQKYKKRMSETIESESFKKLINVSEEECLKRNCSVPCNEYKELRQEYLKCNSILLQPLGVEECKIEYDLLKHVFRPNAESEEKKLLIQEHINRFHLNREMYSSSILHVCEFIIAIRDNVQAEIECEGLFNILKEYPVENRIGLEFIRFLKNEFRDTHAIIEFCELLLVLEYI